MFNTLIEGRVLWILAAVMATTSADGSYGEQRPYYHPIVQQYQGGYHQAGFRDTYGGVAALYRNDQRQEYVNNIAHQQGTGLGTAPWYGVPGTSYDFTKAQTGHGYGGQYTHSRPNGYGYQSSLPYNMHSGYGGH